MVKVGIDTLAIYTSRYALMLSTLANARGVDPQKYEKGLGQKAMSVLPPDEDIVTMAANAAAEALQDIDIAQIEMFLFATESGIDYSKAAGIYVHELLGLPTRCRTLELKQACYAGTAGLQLALSFLRENPDKKVLLIAADCARYGLGTSGESSQGSGAVAMVLAANPRVLALEPEYGVVTENVMDFWRPNYLHEALVDGKYSSKLYLTMLEKSWQQYHSLSGRHFADHAYFCYHTPVPRLVEKAHQYLQKVSGHDASITDTDEFNQIQYALNYGRQIGNSYTASLYIGLASLLDLAPEDLTGKRIGFYSYGSGCVAEYFSGVIQPQYKNALHTSYHTKLFTIRSFLTYAEYESFYNYKYPEDGSDQEIPVHKTGKFRLSGFKQHKRIYEKLHSEQDKKDDDARESAKIISLAKTYKNDKHPNANNDVIRVMAPGKLILSGEHSAVYGQPALAIAINRYVTTTITREAMPQISFDLSDLAHHSHLSFNALRHLKDRIKRKYHRFIRGDFSIREVLQKPFELAQFALGVLAESLNLSLPHGVKIHLQSDIPIGCGLGSSAATIVSVMHALSYFLQESITPETLFRLALEAENMQHGHSSGLDLHVALNGGCLYMNGNGIEKRNLPQMPMYLVNTGTPVSSTGQCVEKARPYFKSQEMLADFASVTKAMDTALAQQSWADMCAAIRENQRLLVAIGVVPQKVQQFVEQIERVQGAGKICGSGTVIGNQAGAVLVAAEDKSIVTSLCTRFGYNVIPITGESRGVYAA